MLWPSHTPFDHRAADMAEAANVPSLLIFVSFPARSYREVQVHCTEMHAVLYVHRCMMKLNKRRCEEIRSGQHVLVDFETFVDGMCVKLSTE
jgi:hypothetical protein